MAFEMGMKWPKASTKGTEQPNESKGRPRTNPCKKEKEEKKKYSKERKLKPSLGIQVRELDRRNHIRQWVK